jgi:DNA-binding transcriptional regulator YdaS (Cro superfamily)
MKKLSARMRAARRHREQGFLEVAANQAGSFSALARELGVSPQAVHQWLKKGTPVRRCSGIERACEGVAQCEQLNEAYNLVEVRPYRHTPPTNAIYLSGPMTGKVDLNRPAFNAEAARLRNLGYRVINPAEFELAPDTTWAGYMRHDIVAMLTHCDTLVVLPGWNRSKGAQLEVYLARQLELRVVKAGSLK